MSNDKRKFYSISQENRQVYSILAELEGQKRNLSDYVCKAIIEKYNRDKNSMSAEDMMRTLLSMMNGNTVQAPMAQPIAVQPIQQPITPAPQPEIIVQEQTAEVIAESIQENKDDESVPKDENQALAIEFRKKYCDDEE